MKMTILNEEIDLKFNMGTMLAYEEIMGEPFFGQQFDTQKSRYALLYAVILTSKPDTGITAEALLKEASWNDINGAFTAVTKLMGEWFNIPEAMQAAEPPVTGQDEGGDTEKQKN